MAWLIVRVYADRQGGNLVEVLKQRSASCTPEAADIAQLIEKCAICIEVCNGVGTPSLREWPWSVIAYLSRRKDGIGSWGSVHIRLLARPKRKATA